MVSIHIFAKVIKMIFMRKIMLNVGYLVFMLAFILSGCQHKQSVENPGSGQEFQFVFMTDIHIQPEQNARQGFQQAIDSVNKLNPDFVITGGDLVMDALGQNFNRADQLYNLYAECLNKFDMPVYNTMGNHEIFGIYNESGVEKNHPEYGENMYEKRLGKRYYSFDHKGWHFIILDGIEDTGESSYIGEVDSIQMEWIRSDLKKINPEIPVVVSIHIPLITTYMQVIYGAMSPNEKNEIVVNSKEVLDLFDGYNLKLVLQGHMHFLEDIYTQGTHFITGGAVCAKWWQGKEYELEEGFLIISVKGDEFEWKYFDYGWNVERD
jgi:3',5'-cyclic-AMP phosphodiesterase